MVLIYNMVLISVPKLANEDFLMYHFATLNIGYSYGYMVFVLVYDVK